MGFSISFNGTILCLYSENREAAESLLKASLAEANGKPLTLTIIADSWIDELCQENKDLLTSSRPVYRYHTTAPPKQINWDFVHILNAGIHII